MSFVSPEQQRLIVDLVLRRISEDEFFSAFPTNRAQASNDGLAMLQRGLQERDALAVELGLSLGHLFGITLDYLATLNPLANADWHQRHEDVVAALGKLASASSIEPLYEAARAKHDYLAYDDAHALASKAIHALERIASREAIQKLGDLTLQGPPVVRDRAKRVLSRVAAKGGSEQLRALAQQLLERT